MTTFSQSLKLELIGDGQQSGTWGQTTNKNLGTLLEQAITGVITITMVDTNYTLTSFNGVSDEARNAVIVVAGTNSAQRDIIAPLVDKIYTIKNSTVGGYAIRVRGASGAAITIPNGVTTSVYCDGSDFYNMQVGTVGNETINGNLTVTGTANIAGATTLGANLSGTTATFSGAISSASPSFTGVPTAPTAPFGTNTTQIATTAFVQSYFASGTTLLFAQASAPTGWTQINLDSTNNRMIRVVNGAGGGYAGSNSPILMDVVPSHTHTYSSTSGGQSNDHVHGYSGVTEGVSNDHTHSGTTAGNGTHNHNAYVNGNGGTDYTGLRNDTTSAGTNVGSGYIINSGFHDHSFTTGGQSANHTHNYSGNTNGVSAGHTHTISGTTATNAGAVNWQPRYLDVIACTKS